MKAVQFFRNKVIHNNNNAIWTENESKIAQNQNYEVSSDRIFNEEVTVAQFVKQTVRRLCSPQCFVPSSQRPTIEPRPQPEVPGPHRQNRLPYNAVTIAHFIPCTAQHINTLRTGDADLRFYITTAQDG